MEAYQQTILIISAFVIAIVFLKVFFTLWRLLDKKLHPENIYKTQNTPEVVFKDLKKKYVTIHMKNGNTLNKCFYKKCLYFGDSEFGVSSPIYFEIKNSNNKLIYISGADIWTIEEE